MPNFICDFESANLHFFTRWLCFILLALSWFSLLAHSTPKYLLRILDIERVNLYGAGIFIHFGECNKLIDIIFKLLQLKSKEIYTLLPPEFYLLNLAQ
jgi:hypothetical protein